MHHVSHHIVGDTSHGRGDHNRLWRMHFGVHRLLLHAWRLRLDHPLDGTRLMLEAPLDTVWLRVLRSMGWESAFTGERVGEPAGPPC
jgi:tRNA pseudouridine65 synthase